MSEATAPDKQSEQEQVRHLMALLAPGTPLRSGLERIVHGRTGGLIVLGETDVVREVSTGGFRLDVQLTPQALRELCKMDGGLVVSADHERILAAGVHFVPDGRLPTMETGTRHRTADRLSQQTGQPVVVVSASMSTMTLFLAGRAHPIAEPGQLLGRADQALDTLTSYRQRIVEESSSLTVLEVRDAVTVRDIASLARRVEMFRRIDAEVRGLISALGVEGRLIQLQRTELTTGIDDLARLIAEDYRPEGQDPWAFSLAALVDLSWTDLSDLDKVAAAIGFPPDTFTLQTPLRARGHRQLTQIADMPPRVAQAVVEHFGSLQALVAASIQELSQLNEVGSQRARTIRESLERIFESDRGQDLR